MQALCKTIGAVDKQTLPSLRTNYLPQKHATHSHVRLTDKADQGCRVQNRVWVLHMPQVPTSTGLIGQGTSTPPDDALHESPAASSSAATELLEEGAAAGSFSDGCGTGGGLHAPPPTTEMHVSRHSVCTSSSRSSVCWSKAWATSAPDRLSPKFGQSHATTSVKSTCMTD